MRDDEDLRTGPAYVGENVYQPGPENFSTIGGQPRVGDMVLYRSPDPNLWQDEWPPEGTGETDVLPMTVTGINGNHVAGMGCSSVGQFLVTGATQGPGPGQWQWRD